MDLVEFYIKMNKLENIIKLDHDQDQTKSIIIKKSGKKIEHV